MLLVESHPGRLNLSLKLQRLLRRHCSIRLSRDLVVCSAETANRRFLLLRASGERGQRSAKTDYRRRPCNNAARNVRNALSEADETRVCLLNRLAELVEIRREDLPRGQLLRRERRFLLGLARLAPRLFKLLQLLLGLCNVLERLRGVKLEVD